MPRGHSERSALLYMGSEIERMAEASGASSDAVEDAVRLCGDVIRSKYDYNSLDSTASACFYLACERQDESVALPDIAEVSRKLKTDITNTGGSITDSLDIALEPTRAEAYLEEGIKQYDFSESEREECFKLLERGRDRNLHSGLAPTTVAGSILYAVSKKNRMGITQGSISDTVNKTEVSIRNNYREFLKVADAVPVDVLPPQSIDETLAKLNVEFERLPYTYVEEARELTADLELNEGEKKAGVAGAAYLTVADANGSSLGYDEVADAVGVSPNTIRSHSKEVKYDN